MTKIIADSTCDLPKEMRDQYRIKMVPLTITINGKEYRDNIDIELDKFYRIIKDLNVNLSTSTPSPAEYVKAFDEAIKEGHTSILCICMTSETSGSYQAAAIGKEYFYEKNPDSKIKIHVVDSKGISHGTGYLILKAAMLREKGFSFRELVEFVEVYKKNIKHFLSVDDLDHIIRSGRLSNASAFIGKILRIKPIMSIRDGKAVIVGKERGNQRVLNHFIREFKRRNDEDLTDFIIIGYTTDQTWTNILKKKIRQETDFKGEIYIMRMGMTVGNHIGRGALSMFFVEEGHRKDGLLINEIQALVEKKNEFVTKLKSKI